MIIGQLAKDIADALEARHDGQAVSFDDGTISVSIGPNAYDILIEEFDEDEDDPIDDGPIPDYEECQGGVTDHTTLLDAVRAFLAHGVHRDHVRGLTTDGDHKDCEAIFKYDDLALVIKIR